MNQINLWLRKLRLIALYFAFLCVAGKANATLYTAVLSGSFSSAATWGGIIPGSLLSSDIIIIPAGINVSLTGIEEFSGSSSLTVDGMLTGGTLIMTSGTLAGIGSIDVDSAALGLTTGFSFTGDLTARALTSTGTTISGGANILATQSLHLVSGTMNVASGDLTLGNNSTIMRSGGDLSTSGSGALDLDSVYNVMYVSSSATTGAELGGSMLNNIMINVSGTVTMAGNASLNGMLTLTNGTLALNGHTFTFNGSSDLSASGAGVFSGSSSSDIVINSTSGLTGALRFATGSSDMLNNLTVNTTSGNAMLGTDLSINSVLNLSSGALSLNGHTLTIASSGDITGSGTLSGSSMSNLVINATGGVTGMLKFSSGSSLLNNLTINTTSGGATIGSNLNLNGMLSLTSGSLTLGSHTLTLSGSADIAVSGTGSLMGSATSNLVLNTTGSITGALNFASVGNMQNNLTVNMGSGSTLSLGSNLMIDGALNLMSGRIKLGSNNLSLGATGTVTGGSLNSYVVTDGTGTLTLSLAASTTDSFMVGTMSSFAPLALSANASATTGDASVNVGSGVMANGTTGTLLSGSESMVNATWYVSSIASTVNYNMTAMWTAALEVNGFDRGHAFISHYTSGAWDAYMPSAAGTSGSLYNMTRTGITSLSPFMVTDHAIGTTSVASVAGNDGKVSFYPNPATSTLHLSNAADVHNIHIMDVTGNRVFTSAASDNINVSSLPAGAYEIQFIGKNLNVVQKFIKL